MKRYVTFVPLIFLAACLYVAAGSTAAASTRKDSQTLQNLNAAYNGESNARVRYQAFAKKADEEGYGRVASLFRAAARAEQIHSQNHAEVIKSLGGTPEANIQTAEVKSTKENVEAAVKGETYEKETMYPSFIEEAENAGEQAAIRTFVLAKLAEGEHAKLYSEALSNLSQWREATVFYVCPVCGFTTANPDFKRCPSCGTQREKFEEIM